MAALPALQVFWLGFLASRRGGEMGVPAVPLGDLYSREVWERLPRTSLRLRAPVHRILVDDDSVKAIAAGGNEHNADYYVLALPFERVPEIVPGLQFQTDGWEHSPITGVHLWFDRPVTSLPQATLLDRTIQWFFNKDGGRYLQIVVSASRSLVPMPRADIVALAMRELVEFLPEAGRARLERAQVIKEVRATFAAKPGLEALRPPARTKIGRLYLAGDWTRSGWPATMEGAVRSGYLAAEAILADSGRPRRLLLAAPGEEMSRNAKLPADVS